MKIIQSLVRQIAGELQIDRGDQARGACFTVRFARQPAPAAKAV
jgi:two-component sensor histidine kinase